MAVKNLNRKDIMANCLAEINKMYPDSVCGVYSQIGNRAEITTIPSGSISADYALGGGFARMVEILGFPSTGKTTLALTAIANYQKDHDDANILYCDAEFAFDPKYATALGVDMEKLILLQPESAVEGYNIIEMFIKSGVADLVVIDSIAAMLPPEYTDGNIGDEVKIGAMARLTTQAVSRINRVSKQFDCKVIFINQYKESTRINAFSTVPGEVGGTTKYAPGGPQKDFYFQQIVEIRRGGQLKQGDKIVSNITNMKLLKNKVAPPYRTAEFCITFGKGLDKAQELIGLGLSQKFIKVKGAYYTIVDENDEPLSKPINGRLKLGEFLAENEEVAGKLEEILRRKLNGIADDGKNNHIQIDRNTGADEPVPEDEKAPTIDDVKEAVAEENAVAAANALATEEDDPDALAELEDDSDEPIGAEFMQP